MNDELENELAQDEETETGLERMLSDETVEIMSVADLSEEEVDLLWGNESARASILMQLFGGLLAGLHPLREGEITISDKDVREAANKIVTINRHAPEGEAEGFFHVKLTNEE
jgi:hypothetical protein